MLPVPIADGVPFEPGQVPPVRLSFQANPQTEPFCRPHKGALQEPVCMASLISVKAKENVLGKDILLFSNPNDAKNRHSITIKASLDGGVTWLPENQLLLDAGWGWGY